jgi:hypothetical protein
VNVLLSWCKRGSRPSRRRTIRRVRPQLEQLEDRLALSGVWTAQGPGPLLQGQPSGLTQQGNSDVGAVNALVPGPTDNILYAATVNGGIWETQNATASSPTWTPLTDNLPNLAIGDLAVSPLNSNTLYAGTGNFSNGSFGEYGMSNSPVGDGVLISTDGGQTWNQYGQSTLAGQNIRSILPTKVTNSNEQVVLAGTVSHSSSGGVYVSMDSGQTWTRISGSTGSGLPDGDVKSLVEDPNNPDIIYAGVVKHGVYESSDAGQTWTKINGNISDLLTQMNSNYQLSGTGTLADNLKLATSTNNGTTTLFLLTGGPSATQSGSKTEGASYLFYSTDGGTKWTAMDPVPLINKDGQEGNNLALAADPTDPTVVWVTGSAADVGGGGKSIVYRGDYSQASGSQWVYAVWDHAEGNPAEPNTPTVVHSDGRYLGFDKDGNLLLTCDGGIYKLINPEGAANQRYWVSLNGTLQDTEFYSVGYDSIDHIVVGGAQDNGMGVQTTPGQPTWNTGFDADVTHVAVDNSGSTALLYGIGPGFVNTDSKGNITGTRFMRGEFSQTAQNVSTQIKLAAAATSTEYGSGLSSADQQVTDGTYIPFVLDSADPQWLLIGYNDLYVSTDQGDVIADVTPSGVSGPFTALAFGGTANPNVAVAGTSSGQLFVSVNANSGGTAGATFTLATTFANSVVRSIAFDPNDWHTVYIVTTSTTDNSGHIWQMTIPTNGGTATPIEITGNLSTQASLLQTVVAVSPAPGVTTLLVGGYGTGNGGVFNTVGRIDGSATQWQLLGTGLPNVTVHDLVYNAADNVLVAATFGRGAWTLSNLAQVLVPPAPPAPPAPPSPPASPPAPPTLNAPPLLAFFDSLLGAVETINADGTETITDYFFGIPLIVATFDDSGNLASASLFGMPLPNWIWNL